MKSEDFGFGLMADSSTFILDIVPEDFAVESVLCENVFIGSGSSGIWSNYTLVLFVMLVVFGPRCRFTCLGFFPLFNCRCYDGQCAVG